MKKTTTIFKLKVDEVRPDHYHVKFNAAGGDLDVVMERSSIRHIIEILDESIGTGIKQKIWESKESEND